MFKKIAGYILVIIGFTCFLLVGGGSVRYRNKSALKGISVSDGILIMTLIILIPVIGYFLMKIGFKIIKRENSNDDNDTN